MQHPQILPIHRLARYVGNNQAIVSEIAHDGHVVREDVRDMRTFSEGQRQRVLVAAVLREPRVRL